MCVCLHPRRGRPTRSAKREARSETKKKQPSRTSRTASPVFFPFGHSVRLDHGRRTVCAVEERTEGQAAGYPWSVSVSRAVQRGSGGARSSRLREKQKTSRRFVSSPPNGRFGVCVTKEGLSAPDRSSEKSANAFLMSGAERRREKRVPGVARKTNTQKNANREGKRNPANASKRRSRLSSTARAAGVS